MTHHSHSKRQVIDTWWWQHAPQSLIARCPCNNSDSNHVAYISWWNLYMLGFHAQTFQVWFVWCHFCPFLICNHGCIFLLLCFVFCVLNLNRALKYTYVSHPIVFWSSQWLLAAPTDDLLPSASVKSQLMVTLSDVLAKSKWSLYHL